MKHIPNLFTLLNLFFGCLAIVFLLQNGIVIYESPEGKQLLILPEKIWLGSLFIALAAIVDFLDGFIARLFSASSELGKQLDSLADVVSFGVAPGVILFQFLRLSFANEEDGLNTSMIWLAPAFIIPCAAAWRLGKFNIDTTQSYSFRGVPTPAVGLLIASFPMIYWYTDYVEIKNLFFNSWLLYAAIALLSWLMVSNLPVMSMKLRSRSLKDNLPRIILLLLSLILIFLFQWLAVPFIFLLYIVLSLAFKKQIA